MQTFRGKNNIKMQRFGLLLMEFHLYMKFIWMQENSENGAKQVTWRQQDVVGASGPTLQCWPMAMWHRPVPPYPCPCHQSVGQLLHCLTNIDFMLIQAVDEIHSPWIHGPIVIHLRAINQPCNHLSDQIFTHAAVATDFGRKPWPYNAMAVQRRTYQHPHKATRCPRHLCCLSTAYKYPLAP